MEYGGGTKREMETDCGESREILIKEVMLGWVLM